MKLSVSKVSSRKYLIQVKSNKRRSIPYYYQMIDRKGIEFTKDTQKAHVMYASKVTENLIEYIIQRHEVDGVPYWISR